MHRLPSLIYIIFQLFELHNVEANLLNAANDLLTEDPEGEDAAEGEDVAEGENNAIGVAQGVNKDEDVKDNSNDQVRDTGHSFDFDNTLVLNGGSIAY